MSRFFAFVVAVTLATPCFAGSVETAAALRDKALSDTTAWNILESLTREIGPRPIGSPAYERSQGWAVAKLKALGFTNIKVETFAKPSWRRGAESADVIAPFPQKLAIIGLGNSLPTPKGGIEAPIVVFKSYAEMLNQPPGSLQGKIAVVNQPMTRTQDGSGYGAAVEARNGDSEAAKRGAVAYLVRSVSTGTGRAPHTGATWGPGPHIPVAALGVPDADLLDAMAARGPVRVRLNLASSFNAKSVSFNISGELVGRDKPDETIVIGGHLDSWDPGTGAIDDGAGVAITTAAAHLIGQLPQHPRRTIRVVLWGSEENGGSSEAYATAHQTEAPKLVIAGESDLGADRVYKVALPQGLPGLDEVLAPLKVIVASEPPRHGGSDIGGLQKAGVPIIDVSNDATRYFDYHHSADDTLAIVDRDQLNQNVAVWASLVYLIAESGIDFHTKAAAK
jgi:hypothetical protein